MIKYIVYWSLIYTIQIPCPDAGKTDEFGRRLPVIICSVYHTKTEKDPHYKEFTERKSAFEFYNKAKRETGIEDVKIDSLIIK